MSRSMIAEDEMIRGKRFWEQEDDVHPANKMKTHHTCRNCKLVKWYPPLLSLSMIMAGVFCWLYVTKPITVTQTVISPRGEQAAMLVSDEGSPMEGNLVLRQKENTSVPMLNPEMSSLPGEQVLAAELRTSPIPGQNVAPIRIQRSGKSLFQPMPVEEIGKKLVKPELSDAVKAAYEQGNASKVEVVRHELSEDRVEDQVEDTVEEAREAFPSGTMLIDEDEGSPTYKIAISLMGELVSDFELGSEAIAASSSKGSE